MPRKPTQGPSRAELMAQVQALQAQLGGSPPQMPMMPQQYANRGPLPQTRTFPASKSGARYTIHQDSPPQQLFRDRPDGQQMLGVWKYQAQQRQMKGKPLTQKQQRLLADSTIVARPPLNDAQRQAQGLPTHSQAKAMRQGKRPNSTKRGTFGGNANVAPRGGARRNAGGNRGTVTWQYTLPSGQSGTISGGANPNFTLNKVIKAHGLTGTLTINQRQALLASFVRIG